jgi:Xaa-Pro dipeptidase
MPSRRRFLAGSAAAATGAALGLRPALLRAEPREFAVPGLPFAELPPAIAALRPMTDEVVPISVEERLGRLAKARRLMAHEGIDALVLTGGTSMEYFTGMKWGVSERLLAAVILRTGGAFLVTPAFEEERALEQAANGPLGAEAKVYPWEEHEDPYSLVGAGLRDHGLATAVVGAEETTRFVFGEGMAAAVPQATFKSGTPVTAGCRMVKDAHEIALMRHASEVTIAAYEAAWKELRDGMTQRDFQALIQAAHRQLGFDGSASVQVDEFSALPHGSAKPQVIHEGSLILIDGGCKVEGYVSDISRTFVLGTPTAKMRDVFDLERRAQDAALAAAKPGVPCEAVDAAARQVITDGGYGPGYKFFTHRVGHGMGMDGHEWPYLVKGNTLPLEPGMTFSNEPGIYIRGEFGVRLEDDMVITETGAELFTPQSSSLVTPFA